MISVFDTSLFPRSQISKFCVYDNGTLSGSHAAQLLGETPVTFHTKYSHRIMKNPDSTRYKGLRSRTVKWVITFDNFLAILRKRGFSSQALADIHLLLITTAAEAKKGPNGRFDKLKVAKKSDVPVGPVVTKLVPFSTAYSLVSRAPAHAHGAPAHVVVDDDDELNLDNVHDDVEDVDVAEGSEVIVNVELLSDNNPTEYHECHENDDDDDDNEWSFSSAPAVPAKKRSSEYSVSPETFGARVAAVKKRPRVLSISSSNQVVATLDQVMDRVDETISHRLSAFKAEMLMLTNTKSPIHDDDDEANSGKELLEQFILQIRNQERERILAEMDSFFRSLSSRR